MRAPVTLKIKFKSENLDQFIERYSVDVSRGGIFIRTKEPLTVGTQLKFDLQLQDATALISGEGTVVWIREYDPGRSGVAPGMGVRFDRLMPNSQPVLDKILTEKGRREHAAPPGRGSTPGISAPRRAPTPSPASRPAPAAQPIDDRASARAPVRGASLAERMAKPAPVKPAPVVVARARTPAAPAPAAAPPARTPSVAPTTPSADELFDDRDAPAETVVSATPAALLALSARPGSAPARAQPAPEPVAPAAEAAAEDDIAAAFTLNEVFGPTGTEPPAEASPPPAEAAPAPWDFGGLSGNGAKNLQAVTLTGFMQDGQVFANTPAGPVAPPRAATPSRASLPNLMEGPPPELELPAPAPGTALEVGALPNTSIDAAASAPPSMRESGSLDQLFDDEPLSPADSAQGVKPLQEEDIKPQRRHPPRPKSASSEAISQEIPAVSRKRPVGLILGLAVMLLVGGAAVWLFRQGPSAPEPRQKPELAKVAPKQEAAKPEPRAAAPEPREAKPEPRVEAPEPKIVTVEPKLARPARMPRAETKGAAAASGQAAGESAPVESYVVRIGSVPKGAEVLIDGRSIGRTPLVKKSFDVSSPHALTIKLPGYEAHEQMVSASDDWVKRAGAYTLNISVKMQRLAGAGPPASEAKDTKANEGKTDEAPAPQKP